MSLEGTVVGLFRKDKNSENIGLPKIFCRQVEIDSYGVIGDHNHYRYNKHGNTPTRAVLLLPEDTLFDLNEEGWKIRPGDLGENILVEGVVNEDFEVGATYNVGRVKLRITELATPCKKLKHIVGDERATEFIRTLVGRRGWYAQVVQPGEVNLHDTVIRY